MRARQEALFPFKHNDLARLDALLQRYAISRATNEVSASKQTTPLPNVFVMVESLYSMDGDVAPLTELAELCDRYSNAFLIIDEAHGMGVYGPNVSGVACKLKLDDKPNVLCCRVYTFGNAMGCHGAVVCGSQILIDYLVNYARSFIYTMVFPFEQLVTVQCVHEYCATAEADNARKRVLELVQYFKQSVQRSKWIPSAVLLESDSPIQGVVFEGNHAVLAAAKTMIVGGIRVFPIRPPTAPKGLERFRIVIHADNTPSEIDLLITALEALFRGKPSAKL
jgi:8-amino-7-oxononanoate synthase